MLQTVKFETCTIWLQLASEVEALQMQGFLVGQVYNDKTILDGILIMEEKFKMACLVAV